MIAIITYDTAHQKTQDLVFKLILNGYSDIHLVVIPWIKRKSFVPLYKHRPSNVVNIDIETLCKAVDISFTRVEIDKLDEYFSTNTFKYIMIAGAGILPENLARNHKIINTHPGYLPNVRGLDALKWAIYHGEPIGVTTHFISDKADEGELIERRQVPIYFEDSFHSLAFRVYDTEIEMLVNSISQLENGLATLESLTDDNFKANRRMPHHLELIMISRFEDIRKNSSSFRVNED